MIKLFYCINLDGRQSKPANDSTSVFNGERKRIKKILLDNGYPKNAVKIQIAKNIAQFFTLSDSSQQRALCTCESLG